jgi:hypothetical protein
MSVYWSCPSVLPVCLARLMGNPISLVGHGSACQLRVGGLPTAPHHEGWSALISRWWCGSAHGEWLGR